MRKKIYGLTIVAFLTFMMFLLMMPTVSAATPAITLTPASTAPGGTVKVTGTGFGALVSVGIGFGMEVAVVNESQPEPTGPYGVAGGPYNNYVSHVPMKPSTYRKAINVSSTSFLLTDTDNGNGTFRSVEPSFVNGTINYVTGRLTFFSSTPIPSSMHLLGLANYTYYQYNLTPAANITTNAQGIFSTNIIVPALANGSYNVTAIDESGNRATSSLDVSAATYDWPMFRNDLQHTGYSASPAPNTNQTLWNSTMSTSAGTQPVVANSRVFIGDWFGRFYCFNDATGTQLWNYTTGFIMSTAAVAGDRVYVGSRDRNVYCLDVATGAKIWNYTTGADVYGANAAVVDDKVYTGSDDDNVYCLNATTGAKIWNYTTGGNVRSSAAVVNGKVYVGSFDNNIYCLDASTGTRIWNYSTGDDVFSSPAVADGKVYVGSLDNNVYCLDAATGSKIWNYTTGLIVQSSAAVVNGKVYVGSFDRNVYCLDASTGTKIWNYTTGGNVYSSPAVADGKVYVGGLDKKVYCLDAATGNPIWSYLTGDVIYGAPAVANGVVYIASVDKQIYAFSSSPPIPEFPSWLLLSLALVATGFMVFGKKTLFRKLDT